MKIKKLYEQEEYQLCKVEEGLEKYDPYFEALLKYYFKEYNLANAELLSYIVGESEKGVSLIVDFFTTDFNSNYLMQISKFLKLMESYSTYTFIPGEPEDGNDGKLGIQIDILFKDLKRMIPKLKVMVAANKYNI